MRVGGYSEPVKTSGVKFLIRLKYNGEVRQRNKCPVVTYIGSLATQALYNAYNLNYNTV